MTLRMPGIPRVERVEYPLGSGRALWRVTHPDMSKVCDYMCCPFESETFFRTWREAVDFAYGFMLEYQYRTKGRGDTHGTVRD